MSDKYQAIAVYLTQVGADQRESGREATADDYALAARTIFELMAQVQEATDAIVRMRSAVLDFQEATDRFFSRD